MVEVLTRKQRDVEQVLGTHITCEEYSDRIMDTDFDLYSSNMEGVNNEDNIIAKFRKNVFSKDEQDMAYAGLRDAAVESQNRGVAAGPRGEQLGSSARSNRDWVTAEQLELLEYIARPDNVIDTGTTIESIKQYHKENKKEETRGQVWMRSVVLKRYSEYTGWFDRWIEGIHNMDRASQRDEALDIINNYISETNYAQSVMSGIAGYFDRYPRIPYGRATSYTEKNLEKFEMCYPYLRKLNTQFKELLPQRWTAQREHANKLDSRFLIDDTVFTTLTVNHNWRTACHRDAGDLTVGFSNICGITGPDGKGWEGAEFILPEYNIAVNLQPGDMLLVNNHAGIHGNDALIGEDNDRLTLVCYFREKMLELGSHEYEALRQQYVEERRMNKEHDLWRPLWNGVSPDMWRGNEWYAYLEKHNIQDPYAKETTASLDSFF